MATIKSYTDIEQSNKLAEILTKESADMCYPLPYEDGDKPLLGQGGFGSTPCWSLSALLGVLPFHLIINNKIYRFSLNKGLDKNGETYAIKYAIFNTTFYFHLTDYYNNPIDACYEMICWLKENNKI